MELLYAVYCLGVSCCARRRCEVCQMPHAKLSLCDRGGVARLARGRWPMADLGSRPSGSWSERSRTERSRTGHTVCSFGGLQFAGAARETREPGTGQWDRRIEKYFFKPSGVAEYRISAIKLAPFATPLFPISVTLSYTSFPLFLTS